MHHCSSTQRLIFKFSYRTTSLFLLYVAQWHWSRSLKLMLTNPRRFHLDRGSSTSVAECYLLVGPIVNWGRVQAPAPECVVTKSGTRLEGREAWYRVLIFLISRSTWGRQPWRRWNGLLWSELPHCAATSCCLTVVLRGIGRTKPWSAEAAWLCWPFPFLFL